jgi:hypothetical protein
VGGGGGGAGGGGGGGGGWRRRQSEGCNWCGQPPLSSIRHKTFTLNKRHEDLAGRDAHISNRGVGQECAVQRS